MTILFVIKNLSIGGAQVAVLRLAKALSETNRIVLFDLTPDVRNKDLLEIYSARYEVESISESRFLRWILWKINAFLCVFGYTKFYQKMVRRKIQWTIKRKKVDIVHSHMIEADILTSKIKRVPALVHCSTMHGCYEKLIRDKGVLEAEVVFKDIVNSLNGIVYLTHDNLKPISKVLTNANKNIVVTKIYNGFHIENVQPKYSRQTFGFSRETFVFGFVARGVPEKGWEECIEAFNMLETNGTEDIALVMAGFSPYVAELSKKYQRPRLHFIGEEPAVLGLIPLFNVGVLPSYYESLPNSVVEFFAHGVPVIATEVGEVPMMIKGKSHEAGTLVKLEKGKPSTKHLMSAMAGYLKDQEKLKQHREGALELSKRYSMQTCVQSHLEFYKKISRTCA